MGKQYVKGFSGLRYWPVSKNDDTGYTTGEMEAIPGAQGRRAGKARLEAEDAPKGTRRPEPRAAPGGTGRRRMVKYYSCSVTSITAEYATKGQNTEGTPYVITLAAKTRIQDGKLYAMSDGTTAGDSTWLNTIDNLPTA